MFKRQTAYIDIVAEAKNYKRILNTIDKAGPQLESITHLSFTLERPNFVYDLLIIDYHLLKSASEEAHFSMEALKSSYRYMIVINVPVENDIYEWLYENGIQFYLRDNYFNAEFDAVFDLFLKALNHSNRIQLLDSIIDSAQNSIVITNKKGYIEYANPYFVNLTEYETEDLLANSPNIIKSGQHPSEFYQNLWDTISSGKVWEGTFINTSKNRHLFYEEATITPILNSHNQIEKYLKIGKNITREKMLLESLSHDVQIAKRVLKTFLPHSFKHSDFHFEYSLSEYNEIGGDFVYFARGRANKFNFMLIDVIGHGVSSALIALVVTQLFDAHISYLTLKDAVFEINNNLCALNDTDEEDGKYVTGIFIEIDIALHTIQIINAGHPPLLIENHDKSILTIESSNMMLGVLNQQIFTSQTKSYPDIKKIIAFTDGLYENHNLDINKAVPHISHQINAIENSRDVLNLFQSNNPMIDDETVCIFTFNCQ